MNFRGRSFAAARRAALAAAAIVAGVGVAQANQLHPQVAQPLYTLMNVAATHCNAGNQQSCQIQWQLQAASQQLMAVQNACNQGDPNACWTLQASAHQLQAEVMAMQAAQAQASNADPYAGLSHADRMAARQRDFAAHQANMAARSAAMDRSHADFMAYIRE